MRIAGKGEVERIRDASNITEIIGAFVELKPAGVGSKKGICPFHDEKTPSFTVRESVGSFHCFGCGEGGDVFGFVMKINGVDFPEALEYVADRSGINVNWQENARRQGPANPSDEIRRGRVIEVNNTSADFFAAQLETPEAAPGRQLLLERNFTPDQIKLFGVGFAPRGRDNLMRFLSNKGFTRPEIEAAGVATTTANGQFDRFQGRVIWPIRDQVGDTLGFSARKLFDDDFFEGKYVNTVETRVYKKSKVLYGLDLARKPISKKRQVVVVEGQTDVMAMHVAGIDTAVASCGTAFGHDHIKIVRQLMGDMNPTDMLVHTQQAGKIIYTFDGDAAGMKAALKTFNEDQNFIAQTYVAIVPDGLDPCDLRIQRGDLALQNLVKGARPMFQFIIETIVAGFDISTSEGKIGAVRSAAPVVAGIKDIALRPSYTRELVRLTGADLKTAEQLVAAAGQKSGQQKAEQFNTTSSIPTLGEHLNKRVNSRLASGARSTETEMNLIAATIQYPWLVDSELFSKLKPEHFSNQFLRAVFARIEDLGGAEMGAVSSGASWLSDISEELDERGKNATHKLATTNLPVVTEEEIPFFASELMRILIKNAGKKQIAALKAEMLGLDKSSDEYREAFTRLVELQKTLHG